MGFTLWNLIKATVLLLNAAAVLNEKFCLSKCTWGGGCAVCAADQRHSPPPCLPVHEQMVWTSRLSRNLGPRGPPSRLSCMECCLRVAT